MVRQNNPGLKNRILKKIRKLRRSINYFYQLKKWKKNGCPFPVPPSLVIKILKDAKDKYQIREVHVLGLSDYRIANILADYFDQVYCHNYSGLNHPIPDNTSVENVIFLTDSINESHKSPALIWIDDPNMGDLMTSINKILIHSTDHFVFINQARYFLGTSSLPDLIGLRNAMTAIKLNYNFEVESDIIRLYPSKSKL